MAPRSFELVLLAFAWAILVGIPVGILAALAGPVRPSTTPSA